MIVHPSLMLIASLDERELNADVAADVKRAFVHLAPTTVRGHSACDPACNVLQLKVNFSKKYWSSSDEGADENWPHVREWLAGKRYFVGENVKSFNKSRGERGEQTVDYREIDLLMAKNAMRIAVEPGCGLPAFEDIAEQLRGFVNAGVLGKDGLPVEVFVPSSASLAAQRCAWQAKQDQARKQAEAEAAAKAQPAAEQGQEAAETNEAVAQAADQAAASVEAPVVGEAAQAERSAPESPAVEPLVIDYGVWGVVVDGAERAFDPAKGAWL